MPIALLLSMQAAGMIVDYMGTSNQQRISDYGAQLQQAGIESNIEQTRLESEDESLQALKALRQNLGTQAAVFAARGTNPGAGSAVTFLSENVNNFNADERMRRMNLMGKENQLRGGASIASLNQQSENSKMWQSFAQRSANRFPSSVAGWKQGISDAKQGFGLTSI